MSLLLRGRRDADASQELSVDIPTQSARRRHKKFAYAITLVLSVLAVPLAVQAFSEPDADNHSDATHHESPAKDQSGAHTSTHNQSQTSVDVSVPPATHAGGSSSTTVTVNGQNVPVPPSGSIHKRITNNSGQTSVDVSIEDHQSSSTTVHSNTSTNIEVNSHSYSTGDQHTTEGRHPTRR